MPIPEPADPNGLWDAVKATNGKSWWWPTTNEDYMYDLANSWREASYAFIVEQVRPADFGDAWSDQAGQIFAVHVGDIVDAAGVARLSCVQQSRHSAEFARIVKDTKTAIHDLIFKNSEAFGELPKRTTNRDTFAAGVAIQVQQIMADATQAVEYLDSGVTSQRKPGDAFGEFGDIVEYMTDEMVNNSKDSRVLDLQEKNRSDGVLSGVEKAAAYVDWGNLVKPDGEWDHKSKILGMTVEDNTYTPIPGVPGEIRYDMWSNIHYGYVGREAGFSADDLHTGADVADYGTQGHTDPADQAAVQFGMDLHEKYGPDALTPEIVQQEIIANYDDLVRSGVIRPM
ncbi:polymorphic toxin type 44 domain-containing protein [Saccharopolyspora shandongensis]|uniref:WXG100-like domain-containing protein n=1 Tax=Saccharopolyspora shandongensis TaxID=418495 RepID=UPI003408240E